MASQRAFQSEAFAVLWQLSTAKYSVSGCGDRGTRRQFGVKHSGYRVCINDAGIAFQSDGGCQRTLARPFGHATKVNVGRSGGV